MNALQNTLYLSSASKIGDRIVAALQNRRGSGNKVVRDPFAGVMGGALFLAELSGQQPSGGHYWSCARDHVEGLAGLIEKKPFPDNSLYGGNMGVVYALLQLYRISADRGYLHRASALSRQCLEKYLYHSYTPNGFFNGRAGTVLTLLHLHSLTKEPWILGYINLLAGRIIDGDSAGVGFVFGEMGHYLRNEAFYYLAERTFTHVNEGESDTAYLHGMIGIGLAKARVGQLLNKSTYVSAVGDIGERLMAEYMRDKMELTVEEKLHYGHFFLEVHKATLNPVYYDRAILIAEDADPGLKEPGLSGDELSGALAGLGQLYLQLQHPFPSLFLPTIDHVYEAEDEIDGYPYLSITQEEVIKKLLKKDFPRTVHLLENIAAGPFREHCSRDTVPGEARDRFILFIRETSALTNERYRNVLKELFELELTRLEMARDINISWLDRQETDHMEAVDALLTLDEAELEKQEIVLHEHVRLIQTGFRTDINTDEELTEAFGETGVVTYTVLKPVTINIQAEEVRKSFMGFLPRQYRGNILELQLSVLQERIVLAFRQPRSIVAGIEQVVGWSDEDVNSVVLEEIRNLLIWGLLKNNV